MGIVIHINDKVLIPTNRWYRQWTTKVGVDKLERLSCSLAGSFVEIHMLLALEARNTHTGRRMHFVKDDGTACGKPLNRSMIQVP